MPLTPDEEALLLGFVRDAAHARILPRFRALTGDVVTVKSRPDDLVTIADQEAEADITAAVEASMPGVLVVGEEAVEDDPTLTDRIDGAPRAVIIDPVDGTWNFAAGLSTFGVILAVTEAGRTVFGLLYDPINDDWVLARDGGGTWYCRPGHDPQRLRIPEEQPGALAVQASPSLFPEPQRPRLASDLHAMGRVGAIRCACHEYRTMCFGMADLTLACDPKPWDHAAGVLAVNEAGGHAAMLDGSPYRPGSRKGRVLAARSEAAFAAAQDRFGWLSEDMS